MAEATASSTGESGFESLEGYEVICWVFSSSECPTSSDLTYRGLWEAAGLQNRLS
jgi:hypothetical protein